MLSSRFELTVVNQESSELTVSVCPVAIVLMKTLTVRNRPITPMITLNLIKYVESCCRTKRVIQGAFRNMKNPKLHFAAACFYSGAPLAF